MSAAEIGHKGGGTMDKKIRLWGTVTLVGAFVCLSWVVFDIFTFAHLKARLHLPGQWGSLQQTLGGLVWLGYFVFFLFHILWRTTQGPGFFRGIATGFPEFPPGKAIAGLTPEPSGRTISRLFETDLFWSSG